MSQELIKQLDEASKEVNEEITSIFSGYRKPKDLYFASNHLINAGGKRLRPFLVIKSCELVGGKREESLPVAAAVEFIHNFTLIHDDIMDRDEKRRSVPTVHMLWGIPMALIAGDMLFAKAYEALIHSPKLRTVPKWRILKTIDIVTEATISLCEGQALDMLFERRQKVSEREYLDMTGRKTGALIQASIMSGAIIGGGNHNQVERLGRVGHYAGLGFQIIDDVLGLTAEEKVLGKPVGSDLREGKRTIVLIHALSLADDLQRKQIFSVLGNGEARSDQVEKVVSLIKSLGSVDYAVRKADEFIKNAKLQLSRFPHSPERDILESLCDYIVSRKY